ncbi:MAG: metallophosphoesterase [Chloroflexi bacterium]|nr:metallophosphoesterase [Chloroflexota bacterium]
MVQDVAGYFSRRAVLQMAGAGVAAGFSLPRTAAGGGLRSPANALAFEVRQGVLVNHLVLLASGSAPSLLLPLARVRLFGDLHIGFTSPARLDAVTEDLWSLPPPDVILTVGDDTHFGRPREYARASGWVGQWNCPFYTVTGNHTFWGVTQLHTDTSQRAYRRFVDAWGYSLPYAWSIAGVRFVGAGPIDGHTGPIDASLTVTELDALSGLLAQEPRTPTVLVVHAPLHHTVLGDGGPPHSVFTSDDPGFYQWHTRGLEDVLRRSPQVKLVLTGHTHSPLRAKGLLSRVDVGGRVVPQFNAMALPFVRRPWWGLHQLAQDLVSWELAITRDQIFLTARDHLAHRTAAVAAISLADVEQLSDRVAV